MSLSDLDHLEKCLKELEISLAQMNDEMTKNSCKGQIFLIKLKNEKLRAMAAVARSQTILANMDIMLTKTQLTLEVTKLRTDVSRQSRHASANKKKLNVQKENPSPKKIKLSETVKPKSTSSSEKSNKENQKKRSPKTHSTKTKENVSKSQVSKKVESTSPPSLPCSIPLKNLSNIWPAHEKQTIFLNNPPIKNSNVNNNIGYYSTEHANKILGYESDKMPTECTRSSNNRDIADSIISSLNPKPHPINMHRAYNMSVSPGYNLSVTPGYILTHKAQVHEAVDEVDYRKFEQSSSGCSTPKVSSTTKTNSTEAVDGSHNIEITNKLFRDILGNERRNKDDEICSMASAETLIISTKLETDLHNLSQEY